MDAGVAVQKAVEAVEVAKPIAQAVQAQAQAQAQPQLAIIYVLFPLLALVLFYTVQLLRALPLREDLLRRKPLSCDVCMATWTGLLWAWPLNQLMGNAPWYWVAFHMVPSVALCMWLLGLYRRLRVEELTPPG